MQLVLLFFRYWHGLQTRASLAVLEERLKEFSENVV